MEKNDHSKRINVQNLPLDSIGTSFLALDGSALAFIKALVRVASFLLKLNLHNDEDIKLNTYHVLPFLLSWLSTFVAICTMSSNSI